RNTEDEQAIFSIFDLAGRIVYTNELDPESKRLLVNIGEFSPGLFNARLISGNKTYTEKLIKL
ncbi:MAG: T9SS type A sorting domain-containing protein, partial [Flavobacteriales bacterium]|nr:T9SS type A sorting domain-containing protein [Flavobacteriales bacterium]